jgi:hypothetical protein
VRVGSSSLAKFLVKGKSSETAFEYVLSVEGRRSESAPTPGAVIDERTYTDDQVAVQSAHQDLNVFLSGPYARAPESERREMEQRRIALNRALKEKIERVLSRYTLPFDIRDSSGRVTRSPGLSVEQRETYRLLLEDCERQIRESEGVIAEMPVAPPSSIEDLQRVRDDLDRSSEVFEAMRVFMDQYSAKYPSASPSERAELKQRGRALLADGRRANENLRVSAKKLGDARILDLVDNQDQYYSRCSEYLSY